MIRKARSLALYSSKAGAWHYKTRKTRSLESYGSKSSELGIIKLGARLGAMKRKARSLALYVKPGA